MIRSTESGDKDTSAQPVSMGLLIGRGIEKPALNLGSKVTSSKSLCSLYSGFLLGGLELLGWFELELELELGSPPGVVKGASKRETFRQGLRSGVLCLADPPFLALMSLNL